MAKRNNNGMNRKMYSFNRKMMEIGSDLVIKVSMDSLLSKPTPKIVFNLDKLVTRGIVNGIYIFYVKDQVQLRIKKGTWYHDIVKILSDILIKSAANIVVDMLLNFVIAQTDIENLIPVEKQTFTIGKILITNTISAMVSEGLSMIRKNLDVSPNGPIAKIL